MPIKYIKTINVGPSKFTESATDALANPFRLATNVEALSRKWIGPYSHTNSLSLSNNILLINMFDICRIIQGNILLHAFRILVHIHTKRLHVCIWQRSHSFSL